MQAKEEINKERLQVMKRSLEKIEERKNLSNDDLQKTMSFSSILK